MEKNIKITIFSLIVVISAICIIAVNSNNTSKKTFKKDEILYALTVDGTSATSFPSKGMYKVTVSCENADGKWLYDDWKLSIENVTGDVSCDIDFTTVEKTYLNNYITSLAGTTQGTGEVVRETAKISDFTNATAISESAYTNQSFFTSNTFYDTTGGTTISGTYTFSGTEWKSSYFFSGTLAQNFKFTLSEDGYYELCYTISDGDQLFVYINTHFLLKNFGNEVPSSGCIDLGYVTTSDYIRVAKFNNDTLTFSIKKGTYTTQDAGIRYEGKNPNNYIWFNNEYWRIIGVFDSNTHGQSGKYLVKIIRAETLDGLVWNKSYTNDWAAATLNSLLNGAYYNATDGSSSGYCYGFSGCETGNCDYTKRGIQSGYRSMIANVTWYLGGYSSSSATAEAFYGYERGTTVYSGRPTSTTGYIGLRYLSDYGYSVLSSSCARTTRLLSYNSSTCAGESWLYGKGIEWTITPGSAGDDEVCLVWNDGGVYIEGQTSDGGYSVRPVLYLDSSVYKIDGDGSLENPFIIGM